MTICTTPCRASKEYFKRTKTNFGHGFVTLIFIVYFFVKGLAYNFVAAWQLPFYEDLEISSLTYQAYVLVGSTPWTMKGIIGLISDVWPLFGYHKTSWMLLSSVVGVASCAILTFTPLDNSKLVWVPVMVFCINLQICTLDLLCEGKYAELMGRMPETKGDIVSLVWGLIEAGGMIGVVLAGTLADNVHPLRYALAVTLIPLVIALVPIIKKKMPEELIPKGQRGILCRKLRSQWRIFLLAFLMAMSGIGLSALVLLGTIYNDSSSDNDLSVNVWDLYQLIYSLSVSFLLCAMGFWALPRTLAKANLFMFINEVLYVNINGAMNYWYTAGSNCVPGGPDFSYSYYITWTGLVGFFAALIGVVLFQQVFSNWTFRHCFCIVTVVEVIASLFDIVIVKRWNIDLGISDSVTYLFGDAVIDNIVLMFAFLPNVILTSKVCPKSIEATVYALLAGFQNFGDVVSTSIGIFVQSKMGIELSTEDNFDCKYSNLALCIFIAHFLLPLLALPLIWLLIPEGKLDMDLLEILENETKESCELEDRGVVETEERGSEDSVGVMI